MMVSRSIHQGMNMPMKIIKVAVIMFITVIAFAVATIQIFGNGKALSEDRMENVND